MNGIKLDFAAMMAGKHHRLSHVYRYSSIPALRRENVAEHSWYVAFYSFLIAQDLISRGQPVDLGKLLSRAIVHDLDESMTGDFLRVVKYSHPGLKSALDEVSVSMMNAISDDLKVGITDTWASAKADDIEGMIVEVVDLARVLSYVVEEIKSGNEHMRPIIGECIKYFELFIEKYSTHDGPGKVLVPYAHGIIRSTPVINA